MTCLVPENAVIAYRSEYLFKKRNVLGRAEERFPHISELVDVRAGCSGGGGEGRGAATGGGAWLARPRPRPGTSEHSESGTE